MLTQLSQSRATIRIGILTLMLSRTLKMVQQGYIQTGPYFQEPVGLLKKICSGTGRNLGAQESCEEFEPIKTKWP